MVIKKDVIVEPRKPNAHNPENGKMGLYLRDYQYYLRYWEEKHDNQIEILLYKMMINSLYSRGTLIVKIWLFK